MKSKTVECDFCDNVDVYPVECNGSEWCEVDVCLDCIDDHGYCPECVEQQEKDKMVGLTY